MLALQNAPVQLNLTQGGLEFPVAAFKGAGGATGVIYGSRPAPDVASVYFYQIADPSVQLDYRIRLLSAEGEPQGGEIAVARPAQAGLALTTLLQTETLANGTTALLWQWRDPQDNGSRFAITTIGVDGTAAGMAIDFGPQVRAIADIEATADGLLVAVSERGDSAPVGLQRYALGGLFQNPVDYPAAADPAKVVEVVSLAGGGLAVVSLPRPYEPLTVSGLGPTTVTLPIKPNLGFYAGTTPWISDVVATATPDGGVVVAAKLFYYEGTIRASKSESFGVIWKIAADGTAKALTGPDPSEITTIGNQSNTIDRISLDVAADGMIVAAAMTGSAEFDRIYTSPYYVRTLQSAWLAEYVIIDPNGAMYAGTLDAMPGFSASPVVVAKDGGGFMLAYGEQVVTGDRASLEAFAVALGPDTGIKRSGTDGNDTIDGTWRNDTLAGGAGNDLIRASGGIDWVLGGAGNDTIEGGDDNPVRFGLGPAESALAWASYETLVGGAGDDDFFVGNSYSLVSEEAGGGHDRVFIDAGSFSARFADAPAGTPTTPGEIEEIRARDIWSTRSMRLDGDDSSNLIVGNAGQNSLSGRAGADTLIADGPLTLTATAQAVRRLYLATLDRGPDDAGWLDWTAKREAGQSLGSIAAGFVDSPEFQQKYGSLDNFGFVTQLYRNVLDREPDAEGLVNWAGALDRKELTRTEVVTRFSDSPEFVRATNAEMQAGQAYRLYWATLSRPPDAAGLRGWIEALDAGRPLAEVAGGFVGSEEFKFRYGSLDDVGFVTLLYRNVLSRDPDAGGLADWVSRLGGGGTRTQVVTGFSESPEFISRMNGNLDSFMRNVMTAWSDTLVGGAGDDKLTGGRGADRYVFSKSEGGNDTVYGFDAFDTLELNGFGFATPAQALAAMSQQGGNVVFAYSGGSVTFEDTQLSTLQGLSAQGWVLG